MNINVLKRIEAAEGSVRQRKGTAPSVIFITYQGKERNYLVTEQYLKRSGGGQVIRGGRRVEHTVRQLHDYLIGDDFKGVIYLDFTELPEGGTIQCLGKDKIELIRDQARKQGLKDSAFMIEGVSESGSRGIDFEISVSFAA